MADILHTLIIEAQAHLAPAIRLSLTVVNLFFIVTINLNK